MEINKVIGINGLGRMGKLILWNLIAQKQGCVVVNIGREAGESEEDLIHYILCDSNYGLLQYHLQAKLNDRDDPEFFKIFQKNGKIWKIMDTEIIFLKEKRNPAEIDWTEHGVELVIEATGKFNYPERAIDHPGGSIRGHFESSSVKKVLITSPLKGEITEDSVMIVNGINEERYKYFRHKIISSASCSTTCLSHLINPWAKKFKIRAVSVDIPHAKTGKQPSLDRVPLTGKGDPCTYRSSNENMFISSTGAAEALPVIIPELAYIPFSAKSIREPSNTVSIAIVNMIIEAEKGLIENASGDILEKYSSQKYSHIIFDGNIFSARIKGSNKAVVVDENKGEILRTGSSGKYSLVKLYGWFDNEWGYVFMFMQNLKMILKTL